MRFDVYEYDGDADCEPPEPNKTWFAVQVVESDGSAGDEVCVVVSRRTGDDEWDRAHRDAALVRAERIADLLNRYGLEAGS